jgi:hypothetical protein
MDMLMFGVSSKISYSEVVITLDFESSILGSNPGKRSYFVHADTCNTCFPAHCFVVLIPIVSVIAMDFILYPLL